MEKDSKHKLTELAVDGGMSNSDLCMQVRLPLLHSILSIPFTFFPHSLLKLSQTQANIIDIPVERPRMREATALGAAIAAGFAVGIWESYDELKTINTTGRTEFTPKIGQEERERMFGKWSKAVEMCRGWID